MKIGEIKHVKVWEDINEIITKILCTKMSKYLQHIVGS